MNLWRLSAQAVAGVASTVQEAFVTHTPHHVTRDVGGPR